MYWSTDNGSDVAAALRHASVKVVYIGQCLSRRTDLRVYAVSLRLHISLYSGEYTFTYRVCWNSKLNPRFHCLALLHGGEAQHTSVFIVNAGARMQLLMVILMSA